MLSWYSQLLDVSCVSNGIVGSSELIVAYWFFLLSKKRAERPITPVLASLARAMFLFLLILACDDFIEIFRKSFPALVVFGTVMEVATAVMSIAFGYRAVSNLRSAVAVTSLVPTVQSIEEKDKVTIQLAEGNATLLKMRADLQTMVQERTVELESKIRLLEEAKEELKKANKHREEFLAVISHELRSPMNIIQGWTGLAKMGKIPESKFREVIEVVHSAANVQAKLIEDLLDMSAIVSGKAIFDKKEMVEVGEVVRTVVSQTQVSAEEKHIKIQLVGNAEEMVLAGDRRRLRQVVMNLLNNAIKFTPEYGTIVVAIEREGGMAKILVRDNGEGIDPNFIPELFERFTQQDGSNIRKHGGLGLGLSIVKSIVEAHGGEVFAESEGRGKGATFVVTLPVRPRSFKATKIEEKDDVQDFTGKVVLLVDDNFDHLALERYTLQSMGFEVIAATSADSAIELLQQQVPDLIVSDISMPEKTGIEMIREIRMTYPEIPAIAVTALARPSERDAALEAGFNAHVSKPLGEGRLSTTIATLFANRRTAA